MTPQEEIQLRKDYMNTFNTVSGQSVLKDLANRCFKYMTTFTGEGEGTLVNEGARQVLLTIEEMLSEESMDNLLKKAEKGNVT